MFGLAAFQSATIFLVAATVVFWKARLWNFSVTFSVDPASPEPELSSPLSQAASVTKALAASNATIGFLNIFTLLRGLFNL